MNIAGSSTSSVPSPSKRIQRTGVDEIDGECGFMRRLALLRRDPVGYFRMKLGDQTSARAKFWVMRAQSDVTELQLAVDLGRGYTNNLIFKL